MYTIRFINSGEVAEGTRLFCFEKPEGFVFQAGQSIDLSLIDPPETDIEGNTRSYSLCSAPQENSLAVATRMRDTAFKRVLGSMTQGSELSFDGPFGSFFLHENVARPAVFLAGGIGVTPFRSIIRDAEARALPHSLVLFYSNRTPQDAPFLRELQDMQSKNPRFILVATMTAEEVGQEWHGERGYLDAGVLERHIPRDASPIYYLAGPQAYVTAMRSLLVSAGISGDDIRFEEFTGY